MLGAGEFSLFGFWLKLIAVGEFSLFGLRLKLIAAGEFSLFGFRLNLIAYCDLVMKFVFVVPLIWDQFFSTGLTFESLGLCALEASGSGMGRLVLCWMFFRFSFCAFVFLLGTMFCLCKRTYRSVLSFVERAQTLQHRLVCVDCYCSSCSFSRLIFTILINLMSVVGCVLL